MTDSSSTSTTSGASPSDTTWLQNILSDLLYAPHISIRSPPGIRLGPGPIDLFSTKFNNAFTHDVKAVVVGEQVDREGLKETFLALQRYASPDSVNFQSNVDTDKVTTFEDNPGEIRVSFTATSKDVGEYEVSAAAVVAAVGGGRKISSLRLDSRKPEVFTRPAA